MSILSDFYWNVNSQEQNQILCSLPIWVTDTASCVNKFSAVKSGKYMIECVKTTQQNKWNLMIKSNVSLLFFVSKFVWFAAWSA